MNIRPKKTKLRVTPRRSADGRQAWMCFHPDPHRMNHVTVEYTIAAAVTRWFNEEARQLAKPKVYKAPLGSGGH